MPTQHTQLSVFFRQLYRYYGTLRINAYGTVNFSKAVNLLHIAEKFRQELELLGGISLGL